MNETEHLIHQSARELQINRDGDNPVRTTIDGQTIMATFRSRQGDYKEVAVTDGAPFTLIHQTMQAAWKGKASAQEA